MHLQSQRKLRYIIGMDESIGQLNELIDLSQWIGLRSDLVQGPGGNTSFKDHQIMWVKASGQQLRNAKSKNIFAKISLATGEIFDKESELTPSIEVFLHKACPYPFVAHTHSVGAMGLSIRQDAVAVLDLIRDFVDIALVPYARPGIELERLISSSVNYSEHHAALLSNHGLLVWGDSSREVKEKIQKIEMTLRNWINLGFSSIEEFSNNFRYLDSNQYLTPDHAVFLDESAQLTNLKPGSEDWFDGFILALQEALNLVPASSQVNFLPLEEVSSLQHWELEVARKQQNL